MAVVRHVGRDHDRHDDDDSDLDDQQRNHFCPSRMCVHSRNKKVREPRHGIVTR
jgi:hypothetical protein